MKTALIMPSMDGGYWKKLGEKVGPKSEPLTLLYIGTYIREKGGYEVDVFDCEAHGISLEELEPKLREGKYDVVAVSMLTPMYSQTIAVCEMVRKIDPKIKIIVGGPHPTLWPTVTVEKEPVVDIAVVGEAEVTFYELLQSFEGKMKLKDVKGIVYRENGKVVQTPARPKVENLDEFPIPDRGMIDMKQYRPSVSYYKRLPAYTMLTTRGCPYRCTFCATARTGYRMHSIPRVIEEMKMLVEEYGAKEILFRDDTFTLHKPRTLELCDAIIEAGLHNKVKWDCITRANLVDENMLRRMKQAGCWGIHFGVEGGTQKLIDTIHKDSTLEIIKKAFHTCRKLGIETRAYMMVGLPGSTKEDDWKTVQFAKDIDPDWAQFTITTPYPGTELFGESEKYGKFNVDKEDWDSYLSWSGFSDKEQIVWTPHGRDSKEVKAMQLKAMRSFYYRPKVILRKLKELDNFEILKKYVAGALALR